MIGVVPYYHIVSMALNVDRYPLPEGASAELQAPKQSPKTRSAASNCIRRSRESARKREPRAAGLRRSPRFPAFAGNALFRARVRIL